MRAVKKGVVLPLGAGGTIDAGGTCNYGSAALQSNGDVNLYYCTSNGIALAISQDGENFIKQGIVLTTGSSGTVDDYAVNGYVSVLSIDSQVWLYYGCKDAALDYTRIALAVAPDGRNFVKKGIVLNFGAGGTIDDVQCQPGKVFLRNGEFWLYYSANDSAVTYPRRLALAISKDGMNFVKQGVALTQTAGGTISDFATSYDNSCILRKSQIYMFHGVNDGSVDRLAYSTSVDGLNFISKGVILDTGGAGEIDDAICGNGVSAIEYNDKIFLYYCAGDGSNRRTALAVAS